MLRVVLDANVYVSALIRPQGPPGQIIMRFLENSFLRSCSPQQSSKRRSGRSLTRDVERHVENSNHVALSGADIDSPEHRPHTGDQFARAEGLRQVIVGAELEADQFVALFHPCGQRWAMARPLSTIP